jgi:putative ABC transport system permease protein
VLLRLAWRNIWRNRRRTIISLLALAMGVTAIISIHSFRITANEELIAAVTRGLVGDLQIHARGYQDEPELDATVPTPAIVDAELAMFVPAARSEHRVVGGGLASAAEVATGVVVMGIEPDHPDARALVTIANGRPLANAAAHEAVIGTTLARELGLAPGGELVLVSQGADGSLANERFTVVGIGDVGSDEANATAVFLHLADAQEFFALGTGVHQIIVRLPDGADAATLAQLRTVLGGSLEVVPWTQILPELESSMEAKARNSRLLDLIVFLIVALGVLNTMTMATFERTRELGVLAALGTRRRRILGMILLESILLGILGFAIGVGLAFAILYGLGSTSLGGLGNTDVMGVRLPETLALGVRSGPVISAAIVATLTMLAGGLIPALRAARLNPIDAMRHV